jgi:hypothetical protein
MRDQLLDTAAQVAKDGPLAAAAWLRGEAQRADAAISYYVAKARKDGRSWQEIGDALGVTRQAAHERWSL